jgi:hypothetical protein
MPSIFLNVYINLLRSLRHTFTLPVTNYRCHLHCSIYTSISPDHPRRRCGPPTLFHEVKRQGSKVNHSSPSSAHIKNECSYTLLPPVCHQDVDRRFTFTLWRRVLLGRCRFTVRGCLKRVSASSRSSLRVSAVCMGSGLLPRS